MELAVQIIINAITLAFIYVLMGLGFAFLFNMLGVFNIAHTSIYMISGYLGYFLIQGLGINHWLALFLTIIVIGIFGVFLERFGFRPFIGSFHRQIMVGMALISIFTASVNIATQSRVFAIPDFIPGTLGSGAYAVPWDRVLTLIIGATTLLLIFLFMNRTRWGKQMQAIIQDMEGASLQGINIPRISAIACALGCGLAALAGVFGGAIFCLDVYMGQYSLSKILMLIVVAGAGSLGGIFIAGLMVGLLYASLPIFVPGSASEAVAVVIVCIILLFRPQGFFGHETFKI